MDKRTNSKRVKNKLFLTLNERTTRIRRLFGPKKMSVEGLHEIVPVENLGS